MQCAEHTKVAEQQLQLNTHSTCVHQSSNPNSNQSIELCLTELLSEFKGLVASLTPLHHVGSMLAATRQ